MATPKNLLNLPVKTENAGSCQDGAITPQETTGGRGSPLSGKGKIAQEQDICDRQVNRVLPNVLS